MIMRVLLVWKSASALHGKRVQTSVCYERCGPGYTYCSTVEREKDCAVTATHGSSCSVAVVLMD